MSGLPHFDEQWISESQLVKLAWLAQSTASMPGEVVEIGVHQGRSAIALANAVYPAMVHAVDNWEGYDLPAETRTRDNYAIYTANVRAATRGNVLTWRMGWREWAKRWTLPIRFAHIDATHTADEVADNIAALLPWMADGAVIAGDDLDQPPVVDGFLRQFEAVSGYENMWYVRIGERLETVTWFGPNPHSPET